MLLSYFILRIIVTKLEINGRTLVKTKTFEKPLCSSIRVIIKVAEIFTPFENYSNQLDGIFIIND